MIRLTIEQTNSDKVSHSRFSHTAETIVNQVKPWNWYSNCVKWFWYIDENLDLNKMYINFLLGTRTMSAYFNKDFDTDWYCNDPKAGMNKTIHDLKNVSVINTLNNVLYYDVSGKFHENEWLITEFAICLDITCSTMSYSIKLTKPIPTNATTVSTSFATSTVSQLGGSSVPKSSDLTIVVLWSIFLMLSSFSSN